LLISDSLWFRRIASGRVVAGWKFKSPGFQRPYPDGQALERPDGCRVASDTEHSRSLYFRINNAILILVPQTRAFR